MPVACALPTSPGTGWHLGQGRTWQRLMSLATGKQGLLSNPLLRSKATG